MKISSYINEDISQILNLDMEAVEDFYHLIKDEYTQDDLKSISEYYSSGEFYILKEDDEIIGTCGFIKKDEETVELKRLRISKDKRKNGYGNKLLQYVENQIFERGFKNIVFDTAAIREETLRFYGKSGYKIVGESCLGELRLMEYIKEL